MVTCSKCKRDLSDSAFSSRGNGKRHKQCKECKKVAIKEHYRKNKDSYKQRAKVCVATTRKAVRQLIVEAKNKPCADCGVCYPSYVMDFDHLDNKIDNVANMGQRYSLKKVEEEIAKCEVVCANCHRIRTFGIGV